MIPIEYYTRIYYIFLSIIILKASFELYIKSEVDILSHSKAIKKSTVFLIAFVGLYIGTRDPYGSFTYLGDTATYTQEYSVILRQTGTDKDNGFYYFMRFCANYLDIQSFFILCAALYTIPVYIAFNKWFNNFSFYALLMHLSSLSFWAFGINVLRNGLAASFFIFALSIEKRKVWMCLLFLVSLSFHKAMLLPIGAFLLTHYIKNTKLLIRFWLLCIIVSFFIGSKMGSIIESFTGLLQDQRTGNLFAAEIEGNAVSHSFRIDFIIYSALPIALGYYFIYNKKFVDQFYVKLLNTYIIANSIWILLIYAAYTDRIAYLSWCIMPTILIYPLLKRKLIQYQFRKVIWELVGSLVFTVIMIFKKL